jgi:hypothetical protein
MTPLVVSHASHAFPRGSHDPFMILDFFLYGTVPYHTITRCVLHTSNTSHSFFNYFYNTTAIAIAATMPCLNAANAANAANSANHSTRAAA